jgi:hypothetical protein
MVQLAITVDIKPLQAALNGNAKQARFAGAQALNDVGFKSRANLQAEMDAKFDRVTPYIRRSPRVTPATPETLEARIDLAYQGGKGVDPDKVLQAEIFGGSRHLKGSERALQRVGILPVGYSVVPGEACPLDQYGNIKGSFLVQLISYFQAFGEQGYKANMTDKRKAKLAKAGVNANGFKTINGVVYFVAYGKLRSGPTQHLAPGIHQDDHRLRGLLHRPSAPKAGPLAAHR